MSTLSLRMAWRNLWRHTQRTILMIAIVAFGSWVILVMWGIADGMIRSMTDTQIEYNLGDLQLRAIGYADDPVPTNGLSAKQVLGAQKVLADANVDASSARLETSGMLRSSYGSDGVMIRGIDPIREQRVTKLQDTIAEGRYIAGPGEILISAKMAASLDIRLGERVVLLAQGESGTSSQAFRAVGVFVGNLGTLDSIAMISLEDAHAMSGWSGLTSIAINLPTGASTR
ncbi:MAG: ABC transporter permease, partial [Candidatus Bipolaricaulota bacterium]|nr:ABC transporter permease [Candidatus Bipolaricaulota bacterium]